MSATSTNLLVDLPVRVGAAHVGTVRDVLLGTDLAAVLGLVVETRAGQQYFLPWVSARVDGRAVRTATALALLGDVELSYYVESGARVRHLIGLAVEEPDGGTSVVSDVLLAVDGRVEGFTLTGEGGRRTASREDLRLRWSAGDVLELSVAAAAHAA